MKLSHLAFSVWADDRLKKPKLLIMIAIALIVAGLLLSQAAIRGSSPTITVVGVILQGVEPGCVILHADNGSDYLLLGTLPYPQNGTRVVVTGYVEQNAASYCMQGIGLDVISISIETAKTS
jgi:hypothetical protein